MIAVLSNVNMVVLMMKNVLVVAGEKLNSGSMLKSVSVANRYKTKEKTAKKIAILNLL